MLFWLYSTHLTWQLFNDTLQFLTIHPAETTQCEMSHSGVLRSLVTCPDHVCLPMRNGLVNQVEFFGLIPQK